VVCSSSRGLVESVLQAAGPSIRTAYGKRNKSTSGIQPFALKCSSLPCQQILFLPWTPCQYKILTEQAIKNFIATAIAHVFRENYRSVAFPAIGCGKFGLNTDFIAQTMVNHVKVEQYPLNIAFIIHPDSQDTFSAFKNANGKNNTLSNMKTEEKCCS
jgi:hypothetical protein